MSYSRKLPGLLACIVLPFTLTSVSAEELLNTKPLLKETVAANPGLELIVPSMVETIDANDYMQDLKIWFKVFDAGSLNRLFSTPQKKFFPPAQPCNNPQWVDWDWDLGFAGEDDTHTALGLNFYVECQELNGTWKENVAAFVYVANTAQAGSAWSRKWSQDLVSVDILDWDDDQQDEVQVVLGSETNSQEKMKVVFIDKLTGAIESQKTYVILNINEPN